MITSSNLENKIHSDNYLRVQQVCIKVQAHSSLEPPLEYYQDQTPLMNQGWLWPFQPSWNYRNIMKFRITSGRETGKKTSESSGLGFLEKFLANNFALSDAQDNTSEPLNRRGIADLPLLRTLLTICQKSREPSF